MGAIRWRCLALSAVALLSSCAPSTSNLLPTNPTPACSVSVSFTSTEFPETGGSITGQVTTSSPECSWSFGATPSWITILPAAGTGSSQVVATATATLDARTGVLEFGDERISVKQVASPEADRLGIESVNCRRTARPGATTVGVCTVTQRKGRNPPSTNIRVTVDLTAFGRSAEYGLVYVFASGGEWDLDLAVPAGFPTGTVSLTFRITDAQGRSATTTAPLVIQ